VTPAELPASPEFTRLFFALWPDAATRRALQRETRMVVRQCDGRPVPPSNFHVTLAFLGQVPVTRWDDLLALAGEVRVPRLDLTFDRYGFWPEPRVFWMSPGRCPPHLTQMVTRLWEKLETLGIRRERKAYCPHLTLCRKVRSASELPPPRPVRWRIRDFVLVESVTGPGGPHYRVVAKFAAGSSNEPNTP
jgi:2'-5' RNA ligase